MVGTFSLITHIGTNSMTPPMTTATRASPASSIGRLSSARWPQPIFASDSCLTKAARGGARISPSGDDFAVLRRAPEVGGNEEGAGEVGGPADGAQPIHGEELDDGLQEVRILHEAFAGELLPHQSLRDAAPIHGHDVEH